jgi:histidyl-tRNA synthetase
LNACMNDESIERFHDVLNRLNEMSIQYTVNPLLVRGLDYYSHTTFEFVVRNVEKSDIEVSDASGMSHGATVLAGGRYDRLIEQLGGVSTPAIGWAAGIDRLVLLLDRNHERFNSSQEKSTAIIAATSTTHAQGDESNERQQQEQQIIKFAHDIAYECRYAGIAVFPVLVGRVGKHLSALNKRTNEIHDVIIIGVEEASNKTMTVKNLVTGQHTSCSIAEYIAKRKQRST